ncbi:hypothetical protein GBAR_LOCUS7622 [Geodia barretti]|uniref:RDD domain-containing protein n=1 Tax=Geodia barretti TaxID=519541 RepID=A0AA35RKQ6_GEOBA|nr:hypothetical protein GBAR_LOCUS7622 [Geodia barretti]
MEYASPIRRMFATILDGILFFLTLIIGYIIWWLIVLGRGQTPGKQLLGIRAVKRDGGPGGWGTTFVREVVKVVAHSFVIGFFADAILLLIDDDEHRSLSDRLADTVIVRNTQRIV